MQKHIISSAGLIGTLLLGAPAVAQDVQPKQPPTSPMPDPTQPPDSMQVPDRTQPPSSTTQGAASVKVSDTIYGSDGKPVGTVTAVEGSNAVVSTGTAKVSIPLSAIAQGSKGATIGLTKAEVEAQAQKSASPPN